MHFYSHVPLCFVLLGFVCDVCAYCVLLENLSYLLIILYQIRSEGGEGREEENAFFMCKVIRKQKIQVCNN